jgi:hypothetical protein
MAVEIVIRVNVMEAVMRSIKARIKAESRLGGWAATVYKHRLTLAEAYSVVAVCYDIRVITTLTALVNGNDKSNHSTLTRDCRWIYLQGATMRFRNGRHLLTA